MLASLALTPALQAGPCKLEAGPAGLAGAYLHTIVLLVSSTLPACRGEKVEGYQHQAGHQGPQREEEQHPQAAEDTEPQQLREETSSSCSSSLLGGLGTASGPPRRGGPGLPLVLSSVRRDPLAPWVEEVPTVPQTVGALSVWGFPPDPSHHSCWWWPTRRPGSPAQGWTLPPRPSPL